ncbi:molybdopterin-binding protein [Tepidibacter aestuarii]|uniref:molybdopterin-binding protein n=1 Tax=Tepidibacter aestuarii TaxID=2925782 RepID=UPI0020BFD173|nr:molybdopterin-binding protein [Tepidibacter aestuarii]CAH2213312.1 Molybdopterin molybdenumtransferase [Tepidibacter aestuarii]
MKVVPVREAIGMVLCHDITQIIPGKFKGVAFKKGHVIQGEDVDKLLDIGKRNIYVWDLKEGFLHENDAAMRMAKAAISNRIDLTLPKEGKVSLKAKQKGLLKINVKALDKINDIEDTMFATLHTDIVVESEMVVGGTRIIPLVTEETKVVQIEEICKKEGPVVEILPLKPMKVGVITTGSEIYTGRIKDKFGPVIIDKLEELGGCVEKQILVSDSVDMIKDAIDELLKLKVDMILATGGMSVDPDDVTPTGIKNAGGNIITYGAPTLPGAMFLMAYINDIPIMGLPGCVMYSKRTIFDLILPRVMAGEKIDKKSIRRLGHSGLCCNCDVCNFPNCSFGKW